MCERESGSAMGLLPVAEGLCLLSTLALFYLGKDGKLNQWPTYLLALLLVIDGLVDPWLRRLFRRSRTLRLAGLLLGYLALSSLWSADPDPVGCAKALANALLLMAFLASVASLERHAWTRALRPWSLVLAAAGVSAVMALLLEHRFHYRPYTEDRLIAMGRLEVPVISATAWSFAALIAVHDVTRPADAWRWIKGLTVVPLLYATYLTGSIAVWCGLAGGILLLCWTAGRLPGRGVVALALAGLVALVLLALGWPAELWQQAGTLLPRSTSHRPEIWRHVIELTSSTHPYFGLGQLTSGHLQLGSLEFHHAHNILLSTYYHGGAAGVLLLMMLLASALHSLLRPEARSSRSAALLLVLGAFACGVFTLDGGRIMDKVNLLWIVFWLPLAGVVALEARPEGPPCRTKAQPRTAVLAADC